MPFIQKAYDLLTWFGDRVARFPRVHRDTLGGLILSRLSDLFDVLLEAKSTRDRGTNPDKSLACAL